MSSLLDAAGLRWVAKLAGYNFSLEYQKGKDNTVADFLSRVEDCLPEVEVESYLAKIPSQGTKAMLDDAKSKGRLKLKSPPMLNTQKFWEQSRPS